MKVIANKISDVFFLQSNFIVSTVLPKKNSLSPCKVENVTDLLGVFLTLIAYIIVKIITNEVKINQHKIRHTNPLPTVIFSAFSF